MDDRSTNRTCPRCRAPLGRRKTPSHARHAPGACHRCRALARSAAAKRAARARAARWRARVEFFGDVFSLLGVYRPRGAVEREVVAALVAQGRVEGWLLTVVGSDGAARLVHEEALDDLRKSDPGLRVEASPAIPKSEPVRTLLNEHGGEAPMCIAELEKTGDACSSGISHSEPPRILDPRPSAPASRRGMIPPQAPTESETRTADAFTDRILDRLTDELRNPKGVTIYRLSLRPHPDCPVPVETLAAAYASSATAVGATSTLLVRDVSPTGAEHLYGWAIAPDLRGVASRLASVWRLVSGETTTTGKTADRVQRFTGWKTAREEGSVAAIVSSRGGARERFHRHVTRSAGYAVKPWKAPAPDGRRLRHLDFDVFGTGELVEAWEESREEGIAGAQAVARRELEPMTPLYREGPAKKDERRAA